MGQAELKEVFRENLHRLASSNGLDCDKLAVALHWYRADKKWLQRVWKDGLARADKRSKRMLEQLAKGLAIAPDEFWVPGVLPHPRALACRHNYWLRTSYAYTEWPETIRKIRQILKNLPVVWAASPEEVIAIRNQYRSEAHMIADWVSSVVGAKRLPPDSEAVLKRVLKEPSSEPYGGDLVYQLFYSMNTHPKWADIVRRGCEHCHEEFRQEYVDQEPLPDSVSKYFRGMILDAVSRPLSLQEALSRIEVLFGFASAPAVVPNEELNEIIRELQKHPAWDEYVNSRCFDLDSAYDKLRQQWTLARSRKMSVAEFVRHYERLILDEVEPKGQDEQRVEPTKTGREKELQQLISEQAVDADCEEPTSKQSTRKGRDELPTTLKGRGFRSN